MARECVKKMTQEELRQFAEHLGFKCLGSTLVGKLERLSLFGNIKGGTRQCSDRYLHISKRALRQFTAPWTQGDAAGLRFDLADRKGQFGVFWTG